MASNPLFRQAALEQLHTPEQLDEQLHVVRPRVWLALATALGLVASAVLWGFFGRIPISMTAEGVFLSHHEAVLLVSPAEARRLQKGMPVYLEAQIAGSDSLSTVGSIYRIDHEIAERKLLLELFASEERLPRIPRIAITVGFSSTVEHLRGESCPVRIVVGERRPLTLLFSR